MRNITEHKCCSTPYKYYQEMRVEGLAAWRLGGLELIRVRSVDLVATKIS